MRTQSHNLVEYGNLNHYHLVTCVYDDNCIGLLNFQVPVCRIITIVGFNWENEACLKRVILWGQRPLNKHCE